MRANETLTPKGERRSAEILEAAVRCLARDGFAETSLQRVADEAGVGKRVVLYYYESREGLFEALIREIGDQLLARLDEAVAGLERPADVIERGYSTLWEAITGDRALLVAWFGLRAEAITNPLLEDTANYITGRIRELLSRQIDDLLRLGRRLKMDRGALEVVVLAGIQGLILEFLERGNSPELESGIAAFQDFLTNASQPI